MIRLIVLLVSAIFNTPLMALDLAVLYRGSCQTDSGIVLRATPQEVIFLSTTGEILAIPRYDIVSIATYPLSDLPIEKVQAHNKRPALMTFTGFRNEQRVIIAKGWPVHFTQEYIQILDTKGKDYLIRRNEIWGVDWNDDPSPIAFQTKSKKTYHLRHIVTFEKCPKIIIGDGKSMLPVYPQMQLTDLVSVKNYLDELENGYKKVETYIDRKRFYAVPMYYQNKLRLGTTLLIASRHNNAGSRQSNFLPLVESEISNGPFDFQRIIRSGSAPINWTLQEEPVVQVYYGAKTDYITFEAFFDPTASLIGSNYSWDREHLDSLDDRIAESGGFSFAFDFGMIGLGFNLNTGNWGIRANDYFVESGFDYNTTTLFFQYDRSRLELIFGESQLFAEDSYNSANPYSYELGHFRTNFSIPLNINTFVSGSYIKRELSENSKDITRPGVRYSSSTETLMINYSTEFKHRWRIEAMPSIEIQTIKAQRSDSSDLDEKRTTPKLSGSIAVSF